MSSLSQHWLFIDCLILSKYSWDDGFRQSFMNTVVMVTESLHSFERVYTLKLHSMIEKCVIIKIENAQESYIRRNLCHWNLLPKVSN